MTGSKIQYSGPPRPTEGGLEIMSIHLHRFLIGVLEHTELARVWVTVGCEGSQADSATFEVSARGGAHQVERGWTLEDLCHTYRRGDGRLHIEGADEQGSRVLHVVPILDRPATGGQARVTLGFVLLDAPREPGPQAMASLQTHTYEAICAARRNAVRLFFDEHRDLPIKALLYGFMEELPGWVGCDHSATMILTSSLEAMTLEEAASFQFNVLAERTFSHDPASAPERLVGMTIHVDDEGAALLGAAFERQREDAELPYQLFERERDEQGQVWWRGVDTGGRHQPFHQLRGRQDEGMLALLPLVAGEAQDAELLGFLALTWRAPLALPSATGQLLAEASEHLADVLRTSSLYALSARKLWILRRMRRAAERALASSGHDADQGRVEELIGEVAELLASHVDVPSFAIASMVHDAERGRLLRYAHPHGWAHFEELELPVDVSPEQAHDSSVSSLAVRLNKPMVLAGGYGEGDTFDFKNSLFVDEASGRVRDVRSGGLGQEEAGDWIALSEYYKAARDQAYATLAYPIVFADEPLGVLTIEVDKQTSWLWWTGFGGHLFWQLVASELASAFYFLGVRGQPGS